MEVELKGKDLLISQLFEKYGGPFLGALHPPLVHHTPNPGRGAARPYSGAKRGCPSTITDIRKATDRKHEQIYGGLGWMGRENKITMEKRGNITLI